MFDTYVRQTAAQADVDSDAFRDDAPSGATKIMVVVAITSALALTVINFYAKRTEWLPNLVESAGLDPDPVARWLTDPASAEMARLTVWTVVQLFAYVGMPALAIKFILKRRVRDFGLRWKGIGPHWKPYVILFALSFPVVVWASSSASFLAKYPFYDLSPGEPLWPNMWTWWLLYAAQFVALEFFFRGFMVHGLKWRLGYAAIFVMVIPYNMIHFAKPMAEAIGAILGGVTLGTLSLRTNSVWWGAALHISVAATMDVAALIHQGVL